MKGEVFLASYGITDLDSSDLNDKNGKNIVKKAPSLSDSA